MRSLFSGVGLAILLAGIPAAAQRHETFAARPVKRQEKAEAARERAQRERDDAVQWAKARGRKVRFEAGGRVIELMALRNGRPIYYTTLNHNAAISTAANVVRQAAPYSVDGSNVTVAVWDSGAARTTHQELVGRIYVQDGSAQSTHATHVSGTIIASGVNVLAQGMAPAATINAYGWGLDVSEMTTAAASFPGESEKVYLSNHSYGYVTGWRWDNDGGSYGWHWDGDWTPDAADEWFGQYVLEASDWDEIVYDAPYFLPFKSAGNDRDDGPSNGNTVYYKIGASWSDTLYDSTLHPGADSTYKGGFDTLLPVGTAKNIMTVGAVDDAESGGVRSLVGAAMSSFSGWGPADDGRIKPDIVANGIEVYSSYVNGTADNAYLNNWGTSMSSPNACGSAALLIDYYDKLFPGSAMRASTLKGLIIHTADDLGNPGPDYSYGWGLMNTLSAAELLRAYTDNSALLTEGTLVPLQPVDTYSFFSDGNEPVRVTLCWTDPPGDVQTAHDSRTSVLQNDLDLRVVGPGGTYWPYKLDYNNPSSNATANTENNVDNVEQVYIAAPTAGPYTVTVDYDGPLTDGVQWYSLLISGPATDADGDHLPDYWENAYFMTPTGAMASVDADGDGADNLTEYISGYDPTNSSSVFQITGFTAPPTGNAPSIINWIPVAGRLYSVGYADNLMISGFAPIPGAIDLPPIQSSYTDTVERVGPAHFYRIDVRLEQ